MYKKLTGLTGQTRCKTAPTLADKSSKSQQSMRIFYQNENGGEVVAVDIQPKIARSKPRDLRDVRKYLVNPVNPI